MEKYVFITGSGDSMFLKEAEKNYRLIKHNSHLPLMILKNPNSLSFTQELELILVNTIRNRLKEFSTDPLIIIQQLQDYPELLIEISIEITKFIINLVIKKRPILICTYELDNHRSNLKTKECEKARQFIQNLKQRTQVHIEIKFLEDIEDIETENSFGTQICKAISKNLEKQVKQNQVSEKSLKITKNALKQHNNIQRIDISTPITSVVLELLQQNESIKILPDEFLYAHIEDSKIRLI